MYTHINCKSILTERFAKNMAVEINVRSWRKKKKYQEQYLFGVFLNALKKYFPNCSLLIIQIIIMRVSSHSLPF